MKATILNGEHEGDELSTAVQQTLSEILVVQGWTVDSFVLHERTIRPCAGCFGCWIKTPGKCVMEETADIAQSFVQSDLAVFLTPVTFGGYSSELKKAVDHLIGKILPFFCTIDGETHHKPRYEAYPRLLVIGVLDRRDAEIERLFTKIALRNAINMHSPAWATGFVTPDHKDGKLRMELQSMLKDVEVAQ